MREYRHLSFERGGFNDASDHFYQEDMLAGNNLVPIPHLVLKSLRR